MAECSSADFVDSDEQLSASQILSRDLAAMLNVDDIDSVQKTQKVVVFIYIVICSLLFFF